MIILTKFSMIRLLNFKTVALIACLFWVGCAKQKIKQAKLEDERVGLIHMKTAEDYTPETTSYIFSDDEAPEVMYKRSFNPHQPLQVSITPDQNLLIRFFSPRRIKNLKLWATIAGYDKKILFAQFDVLPPFAEFTCPIPFLNAEKDYHTSEGKTITIMPNPHISPSDITLEIDCDDDYYKKFSNLKTNWNKITFVTVDGHAYWRPMKPWICREAVAMTLNLAYMFSSPEYEKVMADYNGKFYANGKAPNNGPVIPDNTVLIQQSRNHYRGIAWGVVGGVGGLGGGTWLGITPSAYVAHYGDDIGECMAWFHEFGHGMEYGDSNNTVISNDGNGVPSWRRVCQQLYREMCIDKKLPIYSRRFMHTRRNPNSGQSKYYAAGVIIEDPELDEIDGGLSPKDIDTDLGKDDAPAVSFKLNYADAKLEQKFFAPKDVYVYGDTMYVTNIVNKDNYAWNVFNISSGKPVLVKKITKWVDPTTKEEMVCGYPGSIVRSHNKVYLSAGSGSMFVFNADNYECINKVKMGLKADPAFLAAAKDVVYAFRNVVRAFPEDTLEGVASSVDLESHSLNSICSDYSGNVYAVSYYTKKMTAIDPKYMMACKLNVGNTLTFDLNPLSAAWSKDGRLFVTFDSKEGNKFCEVNPKNGNIIKDFTTIGNITLTKPGRCIIRRNTLFIVDQNPEWCVYAIPLSDIK